MITTELDFPPECGSFLRSGYDLEHVSPFARTDMASGRARQRRTFRSVPSMTGAALLLDQVQAQIFEAWFAYAAKDGTAWFNATLKSPMGYKPYVCRFVEMYSGPTLTGGNLWRFECRLEIYERPILPEEWWTYGREFVFGSSIIDLAVNRDWPEA